VEIDLCGGHSLLLETFLADVPGARTAYEGVLSEGTINLSSVDTRDKRARILKDLAKSRRNPGAGR